MAGQTKAHERARPVIKDEVVISELHEEWDVVSQASWESFPASDPPAWIDTSRPGRALPKPSGS